MNTRNAPISPVSVGGNEWSASKYASNNSDSNNPNPNPNTNASANSRAQLATPPNSGGANMDTASFPQRPRSPGNPSPPPSIARSSTGTNMYGRRESGWSAREEQNIEGILGEHYLAFKAFLKGREARNQSSNNAKDKLIRLTATQFYELSTDVYDELNRRQASARNPQSAPPHLLAQQNFHPKRNNARQTLSSIGPPRFLNLAIDVFNELEKRFPRFIEGDFPPRIGSPLSNRGPPSRTGTPVSGAYPRSQSRMRRPSDASSVRGGPPGDPYGIPPSPRLPEGEFPRPMPKQFQSNTIVPNKSTMVEEDDDGNEGSEEDKKIIEDYRLQVEDLKAQIETLTAETQKKDEELKNTLDGERSRSTAANLEKKEWSDMRLDLEDKLAAAQSLNSRLQEDIEHMQRDHEEEVRNLRDQIDAGAQVSRGQASPELQRENDELRAELQQQAALIEEVRAQARESLQEMRMLSKQSDSSYERIQAMEKSNEQLQNEVREWQSRFAMAKTQSQDLRASSNGLPMVNDISKQLREQGLVDDNGIIRDIHVTRFQMSIDEIMRFSHSNDFEKVNDSMKMVVSNVRRMTKDVDTTKPINEQLGQQLGTLKAKVAGSANNFITASKSVGSSAGLTPVSVLDAAVGNLSLAVVELVKVARVRPTPPGELDEYEDGTMTPIDSSGYFSPDRQTSSQSGYDIHHTQADSYGVNNLPPPPPFAGLGRPSSETSSTYSPVASPRESVEPSYGRMPMSKMSNGYGNGYGHDEELKV
ncbi:Protein SPA2 [Ceratocystis fimbriata CBS 114723]|uniref:Protein SPA2 n=2 Tax=Ceratocystis TaxID=5157 RepID=A0A2C5X1T4_9PEZI|nr:Protein SPA2 [Ceratocystis fimbriata CBS 114723]